MYAMEPPAGDSREPLEMIITVTLRSGVWSVRTNDRFYGDYPRRDWAVSAAQDKEREIIANGGRARVVAS